MYRFDGHGGSGALAIGANADAPLESAQKRLMRRLKRRTCDTTFGMARSCRICLHPNVAEIEKEIVAGEATRRIAARHGVADTSVRRHRDHHLRRALRHALEKSVKYEGVDADRLVEWAYALQAKTLVLIERAEKANDLQAAARLVGEARKNRELMARIVGVLEGPKVSIDARQQLAIIGRLDEDALRALASGDVIDAEAIEVRAAEPELVEAAW